MPGSRVVQIMSSRSPGLTLVVSFWIWDAAAPGWAEGEAEDVLDDQVDPHRQPQRSSDRRGNNDDAGGVAGDTVDHRADRLLPERLDELLVRSGRRLLAGENVEHQGHRPMESVTRIQPYFITVISRLLVKASQAT